MISFKLCFAFSLQVNCVKMSGCVETPYDGKLTCLDVPVDYRLNPSFNK